MSFFTKIILLTLIFTGTSLQAKNQCVVYFNKSKTLKQLAYETFLEFDRYAVKTEEWVVSPETETRIQKIFETHDDYIPLETKMIYLFQELTQGRYQELSPAKRFLARRALKDVLAQKSIYSHTLGRLLAVIAGPHYNPVLNRVVIPREGRVDNLSRPLIAIHEVEHMFDRNRNLMGTLVALKVYVTELFMYLRTPMTPLLVRRAESRSIGAQWEFVRRIPTELRESIIKILNEKKESDQKISSQETIDKIKKISDSGALSKLREILNKIQFTTVNEVSYSESSKLVEVLFLRNIQNIKKLRKLVKLHLKSGTLSQAESDFVRSIIKKGLDADVFNAQYAEYSKSEDVRRVIQHLIRENLNERWNRTLKARLDYIFLKSLELAELGKQDFIEQMSHVHGYSLENLVKRHYEFDGLRKFVLYMSGMHIFTMWLSQDYTSTHAIIAYDIRLLFELVYALVGL